MQNLRKLKLYVQVFRRFLRDCFSSDKFCKKRAAGEMHFAISLSQPFTYSSTLDQKKHNLSVASERINKYVIMPGEVFSFWKAVGNPNTDDFAASRSIRAGVLQLERGGGLCQASGIIYHLSIIAGLEVVERYNHSVDLYTEETRFCPLGSDATVCYGYRDLRVRNTTNSPIQFILIVHEDKFQAVLKSSSPIEPHEIIFERTDNPDGTINTKTVDKSQNDKVIAVSEYVRL